MDFVEIVSRRRVQGPLGKVYRGNRFNYMDAELGGSGYPFGYGHGRVRRDGGLHRLS